MYNNVSFISQYIPEMTGVEFIEIRCSSAIVTISADELDKEDQNTDHDPENHKKCDKADNMKTEANSLEQRKLFSKNRVP